MSFMLSVTNKPIMLSVFMLSVVMLSVVMLYVVAQYHYIATGQKGLPDTNTLAY
jgi:hypothetical protein